MSARRTYEVVYPEQRLPAERTVGLGLQHVIAMFGATVLAPYLMGFSPNLAVFFSGIGTLVFMGITRGRIPSYLGSSFAFIAPVLSAEGHGGIPAALGGIAITGLVYFVVGVLARTDIGKRAIATLMPAPVTAAVICVIGIGLAPVAWSNASQNWGLAIVTFVVAIVAAVATRGFARLIPVLIAVVVGYVAAAVTGKINFSGVQHAAWIGWPHFVTPTFHLTAISLVVPVVVMLIAENIGHIKAISAYMNRDLTPRIGDAFMGDGISTFISALGGGTGQTTYAENIGVMSITRVFSIYPLMVAAVTAIALGFIPKFGALVFSIPGAVMGGITLVLFGIIAGASTKVIATAVEDWGSIESFGVFGITIAVCAAMVGHGATVKIGLVQLDAIGSATFFAVLLNLAIVLLKRISPFVDQERPEPRDDLADLPAATIEPTATSA